MRAPRCVGERLDELVLDRLEHVERDALRARVAGTEVVPAVVDVVQIQRRERRCALAREPSGERGALAGAFDAVHGRAAADQPCERRLGGRGGLHEVAGDAKAGEPYGEAVGLRVELLQIGPGGEQAAGVLAREPGHERAHDAVERRLVDEPLVAAVLADRQQRVQRRHVRGRRGGELGRQLGDDTVLAHAREQRSALREALDPLPAEGIEEDGDDARRRLGEHGQHVAGERVGAEVAKEAEQRARDPREAVGLVERPHPPARKARCADGCERALIDHAGASAARESSAATAASPSSPRSRVNSLTYRSMCWRQTSSDSSCEFARTYARLSSGCAKACSTERRMASSAASRSSGSRSLRAQIAASGTGMPGLRLPPGAEVGDLDESVVGVGEAALVDDQARVDLAGGDGIEDRVVAHLDGLAERRRGQAQEQVGGGVPARDRDPARGRLLQASPARGRRRAGRSRAPGHRRCAASCSGRRGRRARRTRAS